VYSCVCVYVCTSGLGAYGGGGRPACTCTPCVHVCLHAQYVLVLEGGEIRVRQTQYVIIASKGRRDNSTSHDNLSCCLY
jgi:hypothetical protein